MLCQQTSGHYLALLSGNRFDMTARFIAALIAVFLCFGWTPARAETAAKTLGTELLTRASEARAAAADHVTNQRYMVIIDYRLHSAIPRFYLVDLRDNTARAFLTAHGKGSDRDHDGLADTFSNTNGSKMSSLGSFVTGDTYYGRHGLSLKMHGLDPSNDRALERAIVIHGAAYVNPSRAVLGRSWGCPALSEKVAERIIPMIKNGVFIYAVGPPARP